MSFEVIQFYFELFVELIFRNIIRILPVVRPREVHSKRRLDGKTVIITGANTGIGKETALNLSKRGAKVIMACRDVKKGQQAAQDINDQVKNAKLEVKKLDLASLASVRRFAEEINKNEPHIDILVNNAGVMMCPKWSTEDEFEMQLGTNHLGHFLLTLLLLDKLKKAPGGSRIVIVSSNGYGIGKIHFDDLNLDRGYDPTVAYCQSKLANVLFGRELTKRVAGNNVNVYMLHPGIINTELERHVLTGFRKFLAKFMSRLYLPTRLGAQTTLFCCLDESTDKQTGLFYNNCQPWHLMSHATDDRTAERLWNVSEELVKLDKRYQI